MDLRLALDQNFPAPILRVLAGYIRGAELVPVGDIDPRLPLADDWELLLAPESAGIRRPLRHFSERFTRSPPEMAADPLAHIVVPSGGGMPSP